MAELWHRILRLEYGIAEGSRTLLATRDIFQDDGGSGRFGTGAIPEVKYDISKSLKSKNTCKVQIFNLNKKNREIATQAETGQMQLILELGYGNEYFLAFFGKVQKAYNQWNGYEWLTTLDVVDGSDTKEVHINKSFAPKTKISDIFKEIVKIAGDSAQKIKSVVKDIDLAVTENGITINGNLDTAIEKIIGSVPDQNLEYTVQDQVIHIKSIFESINSQTVPVISPTTGMIGAPVRTEKGLNFSTLPVKDLTPGQIVKIESTDGEYTGFYIIQKTKITGSLRGDKSVATCEALSTDLIQEVSLEGFGRTATT